MATKTPERSTRIAPSVPAGGRRHGDRRAPAPQAEALRALTFNIGAAAESRAADILGWLRRRNDDVIVLTETSRGLGTQLLVAGLEQRGYRTFSMPHDRDRGVVLATTTPVKQALATQMSLTLPWRVAGVVLDTQPQVAILGVYVPSRDRSEPKIRRKREFIESFLASVSGLPPRLRNRLLILGDYNAVPRDHEPHLPGFFEYEYRLHAEFADLGLRAGHELRPRSEQPHSWIGRTGNGYLYDYAHAGRQLHARITRCTYLHGPRERRLSDHAALAVTVRLDSALS
jgi:exodeoxyribonuclease-3